MTVPVAGERAVSGFSELDATLSLFNDHGTTLRQYSAAVVAALRRRGDSSRVVSKMDLACMILDTLIRDMTWRHQGRVDAMANNTRDT